MADALASGASVRKDVGVQVPPRAPKYRKRRAGQFLLTGRDSKKRQLRMCFILTVIQ